MACRPDGFKPVSAPDVTMSRLTASSDAADLQTFQTIRWTNGGDEDRKAPAGEQLRNAVGSATSVYLLAWIDGEAAGTGGSHALRGAAEIVGVVTRVDKRRRGIAAAVTSDLVARHFAAGGAFLLLYSANPEPERLSERRCFHRFCDYRAFFVRASI